MKQNTMVLMWGKITKLVELPFVWDTDFDETMIRKDERYKDLVDHRPMLNCVEKASYIWNFVRMMSSSIQEYIG